MKSKTINVREIMLPAIAAFILLTPTIKPGRLPGIRLEQVVLVLVTLYLVYSLVKGRDQLVHKSIFPVGLLFFSVFVLVSILNGYLNGYDIIFNDFFELYKIYIYVGIFTLTASLALDDETKFRVLKFMHLYFIITAVVAVTQYFDPFGINELYLPILAPTHSITLINDYPSPRVVGLSDNPNVYSFMMAVATNLSYMLYLKFRNNKYIVGMVLNFIVLLMTKSRTGFVFFIIAFVILTALMLRGRMERKKVRIVKRIAIFIGIIMISLVVFTLALFILPDDLTWRVKQMADFTKQTSWVNRINNWQENISYIKEHPILGIGPGKAVEFKYSPDNEWIFLLRRYGVLGTTYLIAIFAVSIKKRWGHLSNTYPGRLYISLIIGSVFFMITAGLYHSFQLMAMMMMIAGLAYGRKEDLMSVKEILKIRGNP
ncbi:O-antigen ligase family protein [Alkalibacter mobilis]|uniref:O-antigen ligase family protein n=1 Tax=Alkalibacter mobilis TaxID=2787712 RepID=UPI00189ED944|nr:O-antigen ligase family protein [Alkalibacter mobilis]MBF7096122.1 O-antigen ligase family protein [Alkalibacter mobilis]